MLIANHVHLLKLIAMSSVNKPNRRKEIKAKEALQAQFQLNISQNNNKFLSWLDSDTKTQDDSDFKISNNEFYDLPIIQNGSGLSSIEQGNLKVGDFLSSESDLLKLKTSNNVAVSVHKNSTNDSKAMTALKNNLRNNARNKIQQNSGPRNFKQTLKSKPQTKISDLKVQEDEDEDEDIAALKGRSVKKASVQLFGKKPKGRPF